MNDAPAGEPLSALRRMHIPIVLFAALVTMGSGFGGSSGDWGCGDDGPICSERCAVEGTYALTFEDTTPLGPGCEALGLSLPEGPLEIARDETGYVTAKVSDVAISGAFSGGDSTDLFLSGDGTRMSTAGATVPISVILNGNVSKAPGTAEEPLTYTGTYNVFKFDDVPPTCDVTRRFTATR
jgi:hypothetical protein